MSPGGSRSFWVAPAGLGVLVVAALVTACSSDPDVTQGASNARPTTLTPDAAGSTPDSNVSDPSTPVDPDQFEPSAIDWKDLDDGVDIATLEVPIDYADPEGPAFELYLARHRAANPEERIGSLLVNPGGPGFGGSDFAILAELVPFDEELLDHFDIVAWDPRGTGKSEPFIDCTDDYDHFFAEADITPETTQERQQNIDLAEEFASDCVTNNADIIEHVGTNNSARDIDTIRRALGEDTISYFGFSYGSVLGATWATLFPDHRASRRVRRCERSGRRQHRVQHPATARVRTGADDVPRSMQCQCRLRVPQRRRCRGRVRRVDGTSSTTIRSRANLAVPRSTSASPCSPRSRPCTGTTTSTGRRSRSRSPMPQPVTGRGCRRSPTPTSSGDPTARSATSSRRSR